MTTKTPVKPTCPACGSADVRVRTTDRVIVCRRCGAESPKP